ncbi:MAG: efflux RND transporter permease subunit, partial [Verrucomicrobiota bacterium]|nr:efflux RND transporter permease subunit [Verrucomicrobiota bacterium]
MISRFFIDHPIFAAVLSIVITFAGVTAIKNLPVEQYPNITPPLIQVTATYNGANADT